MESFTGIFINYSRGAKRQYPKKCIIKVMSLEPEEAGKVVGWRVGWPEKDPKLFGRIIGLHGKSGYLMARFNHGLPGTALGGKLVLTKMGQEAKKRANVSTSKTTERVSKIIEIEGIGPQYAEKLNHVSIYTTSDLLEAGATPNMRKDLAEKTSISPKLILKWVNNSDLFRVKGVGEEYADLLEKAGVDTVVELSTRDAVNLHAKILEANEAHKIVRRVPSPEMVEGWIEEAKTLPRKVEY
jgi:ribosomal protein L35AE/L33A